MLTFTAAKCILKANLVMKAYFANCFPDIFMHFTYAILKYLYSSVIHNHNLIILLHYCTLSPSLIQMCLASEAGKMDVVQSHPEDSSSNEPPPQTPLKSEVKEEKVDSDTCAPPPADPAVAPSPPPVTSTSTDAIPTQLGGQNARVVKSKSKRKEAAKSPEPEETPCPAKKKCVHAAGDKDSVVASVQAVARGARKDSEEKPRKKLQTGPNGTSVSVPKKSSKPKVKTSGKEPDVKEVKEEERESGGAPCAQEAPSEEKVKEESPAVGPEMEAKSVDAQGASPEPCSPPCSPSSAKLKESDKRREESADVVASESKMESCGSRKSERRCKGALYKTLVSEGMLTSLRANIDRGIFHQTHSHMHIRTHTQSNSDILLLLAASAGKRGAFRASEHDASWSDDSWTLSQVGPSNPKKLKKSKSKDESSPG